MIAVECARDHCEIGFVDCAKFGIPATLLTTTLGVTILQMIHALRQMSFQPKPVSNKTTSLVNSILKFAVFPSCAAAIFLSMHTGQGKTIYEDHFGGEAGSLIQGRAPDTVNTTGNTYTTLAPINQLQVNGSGRMGTTGLGGIAWLPLPTLSPGDVITLRASLRPASTASNFIAVGFSDGTSDLITKGAAWALLFGSGSPSQGKIVIRSGMGESGVLYKSTSREAAWGEAEASILTLSYNTGTGNFRVSLGSDTLFDGLIGYNEAADTPAPISALSHVTLQWFGQNPLFDPTPGFIDSLKVEIEPAATH